MKLKKRRHGNGRKRWFNSDQRRRKTSKRKLNRDNNWTGGQGCETRKYVSPANGGPSSATSNAPKTVLFSSRLPTTNSQYLDCPYCNQYTGNKTMPQTKVPTDRGERSYIACNHCRKEFWTITA